MTFLIFFANCLLAAVLTKQNVLQLYTALFIKVFEPILFLGFSGLFPNAIKSSPLDCGTKVHFGHKPF